MIYSILNRPDRSVSESGSAFINLYQEEMRKDAKHLVKSGETNVYEMIQKDAEECNIERILQRAAMGDLSALQQRDATYVDATTLPKNLMEAQNLQIRLQDEFYKMPIEVRREFNNSPEQYVNEMGSPEFLEKMAPYNEKILAISKEKSMKEYEKKVKDGAKLNLDIEREMAAQKGDQA